MYAGIGYITSSKLPIPCAMFIEYILFTKQILLHLNIGIWVALFYIKKGPNTKNSKLYLEIIYIL